MPLGAIEHGEKQEGTDDAFSPPDAFVGVEGARPYSNGKRILKFDPLWVKKQQISFYGNLIPLSPDKLYLQGGWVRAPGNVWLGRFFYDERKQKSCWGYSMPAILDTPEWTFAVQLLVPDKDGTGFRRKNGQPYSMASKHWTFPPEAANMRPFMTAFGPRECDDHWIVEVRKAPGDSAVKYSQ